jgi:hypothetical protein
MVRSLLDKFIWEPSLISTPAAAFLVVEARCLDRACLSKHSNQNEKPDLGQESDAHDRDRKEHVAHREMAHECLASCEAPGVNHSG